MFDVIVFAPVFVTYTGIKHTNKECLFCHKAFIETKDNTKYSVVDYKLVHMSCLNSSKNN